MINFFKNNIKKVIIFAVILIAIILIAGGKKNSDNGISKYTVTFGDVSETLVLSGEVEPIQEVEMAFATSGLVERVYKNVGDKVYPGEKIIELDNRSLRAELADALANLELARAEAKVSDAELDSDVKNAYIKLMSEDLEAYSKDLDIDNEPPEVSGTYNGDVAGEYRITVEPSNYGSRYAFSYTGLEKGETVILFYKAVPLGTKGLYLKFDESNTSSGDTWRISVPNVQGASYVENLNAYNSALASRDAKESQNVSTEISNAKIKQAEANVAKIRAQIAERTLTSSFEGIVGSINIKEGEIAASGQIVAKVLSEGDYQVIVQVPEVDVVNMQKDLPAEIRLDAFGDSVVFSGQVLSVDPAETEVDGVSVYEANIVFNDVNTNIRSGMTADVSIVKQKKENVIKIPLRFIDKDEVGEFVLVENGEDRDKVYIQTGLKGNDGFIEILNGLSVGSVIIGEFDS